MIRTILAFIAILLIVAVIGFFALGPGMVENGQNQVVRPDTPYAPSEAAIALHEDLFVADLHADTLLWARSAARRSDRGHVDLPRMREGGMALQVFSAVTLSPSGLNYDSNTPDSDDLVLLTFAQRWPPATWNSPYARALHQAVRLSQLASQETDFALIRTRSDLQTLLDRRARGENVMGGVLAIEGLHAMEGEMANLDGLEAAGYRIMGLQHFFDNRLGGSLHGTGQGGLTEFGREVVAEMEARSIIVDVAHSSSATVEDVLDMTSRPILVSHTGFAGNCETARNISDDLMTRIAEAGGLIGVGYWDAAVCDISAAGVAAAIAYGVELVGADHVALGSDFDGAVTTSFDASQLAALTDALLAEGLSEDDIARVMGGNIRDFLLENLPID